MNAEEEGEEIPRTEEEEEKKEKKPKILIVDSNSKTRRKTAKILKKEGYVVVEARTGRECMKGLEGMDVDLILLEVDLKEEDGWGVLKMIEGEWKLREMRIPIAMFTEKPISPEIARRPDVERLVDYIIRPKSKEELLKKIDGIFDAFAKLDGTAEKVRKEVSQAVAEEYNRISKALRIRLRLATALKAKLDQGDVENPKEVEELRNLLSSELRMVRLYKKRKMEIWGILKD